MPPNGLVIYCGTIVTEEGKEKKVNIDFEPFKPINTSLYLCDNKVCFTFVNVIIYETYVVFYTSYNCVLQFHTEALTALLADDNKFGFIVMDGNGALFGTLQGNTREVLHKFTVDLPKKHGTCGKIEKDKPNFYHCLLPSLFTSQCIEDIRIKCYKKC